MKKQQQGNYVQMYKNEGMLSVMRGGGGGEQERNIWLNHRRARELIVSLMPEDETMAVRSLKK